MRFGLCCLFKNEEITFRTTTAKALSPLNRGEQLLKLSAICLHNAHNLKQAVTTINRLGIGAFRVMSPLFPRMTHPEVGYALDDLPAGETIAQHMATSRALAASHDLRLSFHPDQFVVLSSPHAAVVRNSLRELEYQGELAAALGAEVINLHAGGVYGDIGQSIRRLRLMDATGQTYRQDRDDLVFAYRRTNIQIQRLAESPRLFRPVENGDGFHRGRQRLCEGAR